MSTPRSKPDLLLTSSAAAFDARDVDATGHHLRGNGGFERRLATDDRAWWIEGRGSADAITGAGGDDLLAPGLGAATLAGGDGSDTVIRADLAFARGRGALPGVVLTLSDRLIRHDSGDRLGAGRIQVQAPTGDVVPLGEADSSRTRPDSRPEGEVERDIAAGTATVAIALLLPTVQTVREAAARLDVERFESTLGLTDGAVLEDGFAFVGTTADGWARYARGAETLEFRGFEVIPIA